MIMMIQNWYSFIIIFQLLIFLQGNPVEKQLKFNPPITAYDQDLGINASLTFSILSGK